MSNLNQEPLCGTQFDDSLDDIFAVEATAPVCGGELSKISDLVQRVQAAQALIGVWEDKIATTKEDIRVLVEVTIPDAMAEVGMAEITVADGTHVEVLPFHRGSITEKTKVAAHKWLEVSGFGGLIKREVNVTFARDAEGVDGLRAYIRETGLACKEKEAVHAQTLGAFIRNQAEKGEPVPGDLFNIFSGNTTKLSRS